MVEKKAEEITFQGVKLELNKERTWVGKELSWGKTNDRDTREIMIHLTDDGTLQWRSRISGKEKLAQDVKLDFSQSGELNKIQVYSDAVHLWNAEPKNLEKEIGDFLKNPQVKEWLKEHNKELEERNKRIRKTVPQLLLEKQPLG
ncbi:MAG: hypothetical protein NT130_02490 [Candidatus Micrarchaeota archaeon]|nr:hypothetical protein [Candidatus Micrarchaeota archaeon]